MWNKVNIRLSAKQATESVKVYFKISASSA